MILLIGPLGPTGKWLRSPTYIFDFLVYPVIDLTLNLLAILSIGPRGKATSQI